MNTAGFRYMAALLSKGKATDHLTHGDISFLFKEVELPAYQWLNQFSKNYGGLPDIETFEHATKAELPHAPEVPDYYLGLLRQRYTHDSLLDGVVSARKLIDEHNDQGKALHELTELVTKLNAAKNSSVLMDFRQACDPVMQSYYAQKCGMIEGLQFGWPTLDNMTGGMIKGDLVSVVGRPAQGKSWLLCYNAFHAWHVQKKVPLIVSMEMTMLPVMQRLASLYVQKSFAHLKNGEMSSAGEKQVTEKLGMLAGDDVPLYVIDGNLSSSVEDIWAIARQVKPDAIYIDGGYLLKHPSERDRYRAVAENTKLVKQELASLCPVLESFQFKRGTTKKKKEDVDLEDIGYSDEIGQLSSVALGIFQEESVETVKGRTVNILKGRNGEKGQFTTNWNFNAMDFSEKTEVPFEDWQCT